MLGNCKMMDPKMEKNAAYEFVPMQGASAEAKYFECDNLKGALNSG